MTTRLPLSTARCTPLPIPRAAAFCGRSNNAEQLPATPAGKNPVSAPATSKNACSLSQPTISHHMAILTKAGLVEAVKQGQWRWYRRNEKALRRLVKSLRTQL